ncbi:transmembrane protein, putative (macronuclear) [Tetrahymena thermophila SB210]|uniref:Transmembrane protein, putative n=1 Tax=Tetrahymena thermophila (strain SB210) TaxID=312017 RepID=Q22Z83_TETTS|nr:transmembrane protein, putative [Tetrahymena thermophila SB210]EAR90438.2 transmembrane protein, putative [Tetrahymena thermophila SB210]|eukprot:XP_001010683.2 transmembrane protein, putative [Tetrahymena thermophila SB210]
MVSISNNMNILLNQTNEIIIQNSLFQNNTALEGGAIFITQNKGNIYFKNSSFSNNSAYANGGAILFDTIQSISFDQNTKILFNSALIGGGIRIRGVQEFNLINDGNITNNKAEIYGENIATYPSLLQIELFSQVNNQFVFDNSNFTNNRQIYIQDFQSGGSLDIYLFFMDNEGKHLNFSVNSFKQGLYPKVIENEIQQFNAHLDLFNKSSIQIIGAQSVNYNQYNEITKSFSFQKYNLADYVQTCDPCNIGEYSMYEYSQNSYVSDIQCQKCPEESLICNKDNFVLKQGYWRQSNTSNIIIQCSKYQEACNEQEFNNLFGCVQGYVGPLCEQCDYSGSTWQKRYSENSISTSCQECSSMSYQIVAIVISSLIILIYLFFYIRMMNMLPISVSQFKQINIFYIKCLLSYLQLQVILVDQINKISLSINFIPNTLAQPSSFTIIDTLCIVSPETLDNNGPGKTKLIISQIYNLILGVIIICLIIFVEKFKFNKINFKNYLRYNAFYLLYTFMQPDALKMLSKFLTCRKIGDNSYFTEDLQIQCNQSEYKLFQQYLGIPLLIFWIVLPAIIFVLICKRSKNLNISSTIFRYGYFFIEYKKNKYYWEFVRIYLKVLIVIFFTLFNGNQKFSYMVVVVFIVMYISYLNNSDPYLNKKMKKIELLSLFNLIMLIGFQIILSIYNQQAAIKIIMILLHFSFIIYVIWIILYRQLFTKRNILGRTFLCFIQKILSQNMFDKILRHSEVSMKVYQNWKKIRNNLKYTIDLNTINKMNQTISQKENQTHINLIHPRQRLESNFCCQTPILQHQEISKFEGICDIPSINIVQPVNSQLSPNNLLVHKNSDSQKQSLFYQQSKQQEDINQNNEIISEKQDENFMIYSEMFSYYQDQASRFQDKFRFQKINKLNKGQLENNQKQ